MDEKEKEWEAQREEELRRLYQRGIFIPLTSRSEKPEETASEEQEEEDKDKKSGQSA
jgi:hypothetical protein